jgi:hypothetical protein
MLPDGHIVIVNEWNDLFILLTSKLFEQSGFHVDPDFFQPDRVSGNNSIIAFSQSVKGAAEHNFSEGMSAFMNFPHIPFPFMGSLAEALRKMFDDGAIIASTEVGQNESHLKIKQELVVKNGLALLYITDTYGNRRALMFPSVKISELLKELDNNIEKIESDNSATIINKLLAA